MLMLAKCVPSKVHFILILFLEYTLGTQKIVQGLRVLVSFAEVSGQASF